MDRLQRLVPPGPLGELVLLLLISLVVFVLTFGDEQSAVPEPAPTSSAVDFGLASGRGAVW